MTDSQAEKMIALLGDLLTELRIANRNALEKDDEVLTVSQVARRVGRSRQTVNKWCREHRLTKVERGGVRGILASELRIIR